MNAAGLMRSRANHGGPPLSRGGADSAQRRRPVDTGSIERPGGGPEFRAMIDHAPSPQECERRPAANFLCDDVKPCRHHEPPVIVAVIGSPGPWDPRSSIASPGAPHAAD